MPAALVRRRFSGTLLTATTAALLAGAVRAAGPTAQAGAQHGRISWYGKRFAGRRTASGERFDPNAMTMAHPALPFGTRVRVINLDNGRSVVLRVNDRGPSIAGRIADVSEAAARELQMIRQGVVEGRLEVVSPLPKTAS